MISPSQVFGHVRMERTLIDRAQTPPKREPQKSHLQRTARMGLSLTSPCAPIRQPKRRITSSLRNPLLRACNFFRIFVFTMKLLKSPHSSRGTANQSVPHVQEDHEIPLGALY